MRRTIVSGIAAAVLTIALAGCASAGTPPDLQPDGPPPTASETPTAPAAPVDTGADAQARLAELPMPSATEPVLAVGTVLEQDGVALLCVGTVLESAPPQCGGPELVGWDWAAFEHQESSAGVRWAQGVAIEGTYDAAAQTFTATGEPMSAAVILLPALETPQGELDEATIAAVQDDVATLERPDILGSWSEQGTAVLNVMYDDGSVQAAVDDIYGPGVVFVAPALR